MPVSAKLHAISEPARILLDEGRMPLSDACKLIRALSGISQDELARRAGVNRKVVKALEAGRGNPELRSLEQIGRLAGLRVAFVEGGAEVGFMDARKRAADEQAARRADAQAIQSGVAAEEVYRRNAMGLGGIELKLPRIG